MKRQKLVLLNNFMELYREFYNLRSIIILLGIVMLLSCKNDIKQVDALPEETVQPEMMGYELEKRDHSHKS